MDLSQSSSHSLREKNRAPNVQLPKMSSGSGYTLTRDVAQTHFRKTESTGNHPHQNVLVTRTQVKTLHKQETSFI
jgi:hypothetical protein